MAPWERTPCAGSRARRAAVALGLPCVLWTSGCGTLAGGRGWGQDATLFPSGAALRRAAVGALRDPWTWVPAAAAAVLTVDDWDENVSDWAIENTPLFGSADAARDASDHMRTALIGAFGASSFATKSGEEAGDWIPAKAKGLGVGLGAVLTADFVTDKLKDETGRTRPNGTNDRSFPSMHTSQAFACAAWSWRNLDSISMSEGARTTSRVGLATLAIGTGWARIEAGEHFPTDVLAGAALGNFITSFVHDAFLGLPATTRVGLLVDPVEGSYGVRLTWTP